jgi:hypothetical protein
MVFGICTIGAGAAFENENIQYSTPVQVMAGMGILTGNENGVFNPKGELTRAAAAKIVAYVALGKTAAEMMTAAEDFKDLKVSDPQYGWSVKYVHYLYTKGIVNGYGNGNYGPGDSVTVLQFAKMLLCAIGYGKQNEFVGSGWDATALVKAIEVDMFADFNSTDTDRVITREEASLFAFNVMTQANAGVVTFNSVTNSYSAPGTTLGVLKYNYTAPVSGIITANQATGADFTVIGGVNYNITTGKELIGHYVTVYYANAAKTSAKGATYYNVYTLSDVGTVKTYSVLSPSFTAAVGAGLTYADPYFSVTNYVATSTAAASAPAVAPYGSYVLYNGKIVAYIANSTYSIDKVTAIATTAGSESITFAGAGTMANTAANDVVVEYDGIAVGDYVTLTQVGAKYYVTKATTVEGTITAYSGTSSITLGGTTYLASTGTDNSGIADDALDFVSTYVLHLDEFGKFFAVTKKAAAAATNLFYVTGNIVKANYGDLAVTYDTYAKGINAKGEYVTYKIAKDNATSAAAAAAGAAIDTLYQVSVNAATGIATLSAPAASSGAAAISNMTGSAWNLSTVPGVVNKATSATGNYYLASDVTIIYVNDVAANQTKDIAPVVTIKTGVQAVNLDSSDYVIATQQTGTNNWTVNTVIYNGVAPLPVASSLIYATGAAAKATVAYTGANGIIGSANLFEVYIDGVKTEIKSTDATIAAGFYNYTVDQYGLTAVTAAPAASYGTGVVTNYYNGLLSFGTTYDKDASNAVIVNLTLNTKAPTTVDQLAGTETIAVTYSATGAITYIYITACSRS